MSLSFFWILLLCEDNVKIETSLFPSFSMVQIYAPVLKQSNDVYK